LTFPVLISFVTCVSDVVTSLSIGTAKQFLIKILEKSVCVRQVLLFEIKESAALMKIEAVLHPACP